jgi:hypothetical protein
MPPISGLIQHLAAHVTGRMDQFDCVFRAIGIVHQVGFCWARDDRADIVIARRNIIRNQKCCLITVLLARGQTITIDITYMVIIRGNHGICLCIIINSIAFCIPSANVLDKVVNDKFLAWLICTRRNSN